MSQKYARGFEKGMRRDSPGLEQNVSVPKPKHSGAFTWRSVFLHLGLSQNVEFGIDQISINKALFFKQGN